MRAGEMGPGFAASKTMSRDHRRLRVFGIADALVVDAYRATSEMPAEERFGLRVQITRAAVSVATNIVEGAARSTEREYCRFLEIAHASSRECAYLLGLTVRLDLMPPAPITPIAEAYERLAGGLLAVVRGLKSRGPTEEP
jgi:four helix bundle protein